MIQSPNRPAYYALLGGAGSCLTCVLSVVLGVVFMRATVSTPAGLLLKAAGLGIGALAVASALLGLATVGALILSTRREPRFTWMQPMALMLLAPPLLFGLRGLVYLFLE